MRKPLLALAVSAFGIGTSEFIIMGLLPDLAHGFRVQHTEDGDPGLGLCTQRHARFAAGSPRFVADGP